MTFREKCRLFLEEYLDATTDSSIDHPILYAIRKVKERESNNNV